MQPPTENYVSPTFDRTVCLGLLIGVGMCVLLVLALIGAVYLLAAYHP